MTTMVEDIRKASRIEHPVARADTAESLSAEKFRNAFRNYPAGVALISADDGDTLAAMTATSVCSVSADPPLVLFSLSAQSSASPVIRAAETVVIHLLTTAELDLAKLGATSGADRFADTRQWKRLPTGEPVFHAAGSWIRGRVLNLMQAENATVVLVHALESHSAEDSAPPRDARPLVYYNRTWHALSDASRVE